MKTDALNKVNQNVIRQGHMSSTAVQVQRIYKETPSHSQISFHFICKQVSNENNH